MNKEYYIIKTNMKARLDLLEIEFESAFKNKDFENFKPLFILWDETIKEYKNFIKEYFRSRVE